MINKAGLKMLNKLVQLAEANNGHIKLKNEPYMPLTVEILGDNEVSLCHYGTQNGDLMCVPEVIFKLVEDGATTTYYRNDYAGVERWVNCSKFANTWLKNIGDQGYVRMLN